MIGKKYAQLRPRHRWTAHDSFLVKHASVFLGVGEGVIAMWTLVFCGAVLYQLTSASL